MDKRRKLGQHYLINETIASRIVSAAGLSQSETVCEVGTGKGILTSKLCLEAKRVISYEIDHSLVEQAKKKLENYGNLEIRNLDPFKRDVEKFDIFISNLPYSRSREAIEWLAQRKFGRAIVMVQQEFADKLLAMPGSKYFRAISAVAGFCFKIDRLFDVGPTSFDPIPKVTSSVLRLLQINMIDRRTIKQLGLLFSSRNKIASTVAKKIGVDYRETKRIFQLAPSELVVLAKLTRNVYPVR